MPSYHDRCQILKEACGGEGAVPNLLGGLLQHASRTREGHARQDGLLAHLLPRLH